MLKMLKNLNGVLCSYIVILIFVLAIFYQTLHLFYNTSKIIPFIICIGVFLLTIAGIVIELKKVHNNRKAVPVSEEMSHKQKTVKDKPGKSMIECVLWVFGAALVIYLLGFSISIPLFMLVYMKCNGGSWLESIITSILVSSIIYVVFNMVLNANLYEGKLFVLFG